jgi:hypothetical protein
MADVISAALPGGSRNMGIGIGVNLVDGYTGERGYCSWYIREIKTLLGGNREHGLEFE